MSFSETPYVDSYAKSHAKAKAKAYVNPCLNRPCGYYGNCIASGYTYKCVCKYGYSGKICDSE